tara:strand:+ start:34535 stop:35068 length:534 start_codon:yes stop_codon:yes gene_type:complete
MNNNKRTKIKKNIGIVFWVTGLSGVGKSTISELIQKKISKKFGPTIHINGDDLRKIFNLKKYDIKSRKEYVLRYSKFCKFITQQNINVIIALGGLFNFIRKWNRKNLKNYIEIYLIASNHNIKKNDIRKIYNKKNVFGKDLKPELPKKPHFILYNDFKTKPANLSNMLMSKILKKYF